MTALRRTEATSVIPIEPDQMAANLRHHAEAASGAYARHTERALRADVAIFTAWCAQAGRQALPAEADTVTAFIDAMAVSRASATVRRYVSSIAIFHRAAQVANPCETQAVKLALKRMHRTLGRAQRQAAALTDRLVADMLAKAGNSLHDLRDKALVAVAYTTLCRRSELVALMRDDLEIGADGFGTIVIRRAKGDQEGQGAVAPITPDAMRHLRTWLDAAGIEAGPLFRAVLKGGRVGGPLDGGHVARMYKAMARRSGLSDVDVAQISGHSTRVGASQDMLRYGEQLPAIMQAGRWKTSTMVARYTAKQGARTSAAARIADRRVPG